AQPPPDPTSVNVNQPAQSNTLGLSGFIVSLIGWVTCGILCPIGLLLSLIGLSKQPRGVAGAGTIIGAAGTVFLLLVGFAIVMAAVGLKTVGKSVGGAFTIMQAQMVIEGEFQKNKTLPTDAEANTAFATHHVGLNGVTPRYERISDTDYALTMPGPDD